jgi:hypothetical protein
MCGLSAMIAGCTGVGMVARSDSAAGLHEATGHFEKQDRPLAAGKLIREATAGCQQDDDLRGLANACRTCGRFFRSSAVAGRWSRRSREAGLLGRSAAFDARDEKSVGYFEEGRHTFARYRRHDALTSMDLNIGFTCAVMGSWMPPARPSTAA